MTIATSDDQTLDLNEPIAIVGMGCVYPGAKNTAEFWESIKSARSYVKPLSKTEIPQLYDPSPEAFNKASCNLAAVVENFQLNPREFVGIPPHILHCLEESGRMALVAAQEALNQARISRLYPIDSQERAQSDKTFVSLATNGFDSPSHKDFVLSTFYDRLELLTQTETFKKLNISQQANLMAVLNRDFFKMDEKVSFDGLIQSVTTAVASRISKFNHFGGGHVSVDAACASSGYALDIAIKKLRNHSADRALVGGLGRLTTMIHVYCSKAQTMSTQGSFPFDERASGFVAGEGAGFVVLKRLKDALNQGDDIQAVIRGIGVSSDGSKTGPWAPNKEGQKLAVRRALRQTPYSIKHLQYIECHGTGTPVGDPEELSGIEELLKEVHATQKVTVGSGKAAVGHLLNGAGLVGLIRTVLAIQNKTFPPTANLRNPISFFSNSILEPLKTPRAWPAPEIDVPRRAMVNSFGFGGTNTNLQIEEFVPAFHRKYLNSNDPHFIRKIRSRQNISELSVTSNFSQIYNIPIAVVGIGLHLPGAKTTNEFENLLENGLSAITSMPKDRWGAELLEDKRPTDKWTPLTDKGGFVPIPTLREKLKWKIPPVVLEHLDPNQFRFFESVDEALAMAGLKNQKNILKDTALYCGVMCESDFMLKEEASLRVNLLLDFIRDKLTLLDPKIAHSLAEEFFEKLKPFLNEFNGDNSVSGVDSMLGARIAKFYDMLGGAAAMDNVCSTASNVLDHAINCLRSGDIEAAVVGSSNMAMSGHVFSMYSGLSHIAKEGSVRPFDKARSGTLLGEGAVTFVLRRLDDALASGQRVLALLHDASVGSDGHSNQMIAPTLEAIKDVMSRALISTSVTDVDYVECQGMGISTGDDLEVQAVDDLIGVQRRSRPVVIGSLKGSIGHLRVAGGFAALAKTILSIQQGKLYPTVGFQNPSEALASRLERVNVLTTPRPFHTRFPIAMINVYGVGGGHGAIVVGAYNAQLWTRQDQLPRPQLDIHFSNFGPNLEYKKQVLEKLRPQLHTDVAREILFKSGIYVVNPELKNHSKSAFVFSGQSSAYLGMYKTLVNSEPIFKELLRFADLKANKWGMKTFSDLLYDSGTESELANLFYTNFISCIFQIASFKYLTQKENIEPHLFVGHSLGEFAAAICAGALSVEDGFDVLYDRFNCLSKIKSQGKMAALRCTEEVARELIRGIAQLHLANFNLPEQIVIAGTPTAIQMAQTRAIHMGVDLKVLSASHAYHSPILQDAVEPFRKLLEDRSMKNLDVPVTSFVTNEIVFESKHLPTLLAEGFVSPVHFGKLISRALDFGIGHFVDMGPSWSSHRMVQKHLHNLSGNRPTRSYYLNHPKEDDRNSLKRFSEEFQFCNSNLETLSKGSHPVLSGSREQIGAKAANIWNKSTQDYSWFESRLPSGFDERTRICHKNLIKFLPSEYLQELHSLARQSSLPNQDVEYLHAMNSSLTMKYGLCSGFMTWTTAGKIVHGANYDLPFVSARDQDLFPRQVIEIRAEGKIPFIGVFKQGLLLPLCGVNARGIAVSYAAAPHHADFGNGINATTLVRIILENSNSLADVKQIVESYTY
ncbi:MAG: acyltransferase domain-containing protein, partial [Oligoflexia bacterium]|nr:acyltransferase domain-containing protein [Oligoflexia bacterium]